MTKYVYMFTEGNAAMKNLLGGKGANLAEMTGLGLPVPRGFTISTEACNQYYLDGETITPEVTQEIEQALVKAEALVGKKFGDCPHQSDAQHPWVAQNIQRAQMFRQGDQIETHGKAGDKNSRV